MENFVAQHVAQGIDPAHVADQLFDALRANRFYILTHPNWKVAVQARMGDILEGRTPTELNPNIMLNS